MLKKTLCLSLLSAAVLVSVPLAAMAHPDGYGRHHGGYYGYYADQTMPELSKEQMAEMDKLCEEHRNAVRPLYDQLSEKGLELRALSPNPNVKPEELKALTAEIAKLHEQIRTINNDFQAKMTKAGLPCRGYHHGGYGHGYYGHGCGYWR